MESGVSSRPYQVFRQRWAERRNEAEDVFGDQAYARLVDLLLSDFDESRAQELALAVGVKEAATLSGYHESSIWRLMDVGDVPNAGDRGRPRVRVVDLPFKPRSKEVVLDRSPAVLASERYPACLGGAELELIEETAG